MAQDRPEEFNFIASIRRSASRRRTILSAAASPTSSVLFAALALILLGYWVINALGHGRRFQRCLDSGRINCVDFVNPAK